MVSLVQGQAINSLTGQPDRPGYAKFHSNLGLQEIIDVGVPAKAGKISQPELVELPKTKGLGEREGREEDLVAPKVEKKPTLVGSLMKRLSPARSRLKKRQVRWTWIFHSVQVCGPTRHPMYCVLIRASRNLEC